jgi:hypothetical protein
VGIVTILGDYYIPMKTTLNIYYNKLQRKIVPKFIHMKKLFGGKRTYNPFFSIIMLAHCILFAPKQKLSMGTKEPFVGLQNLCNGDLYI